MFPESVGKPLCESDRVPAPASDWVSAGVCVCARACACATEMISAFVPQCILENYRLTWMHVCGMKDTEADTPEHLHQRGCGNVTAEVRRCSDSVVVPKLRSKPRHQVLRLAQQKKKLLSV